MTYAEQNRKLFLDVNGPRAVKPENRSGVFLNFEEKQFEYWEPGERVAAIPFSEISSEGDLNVWLESL